MFHVLKIIIFRAGFLIDSGIADTLFIMFANETCSLIYFKKAKCMEVCFGFTHLEIDFLIGQPEKVTVRKLHG